MQVNSVKSQNVMNFFNKLNEARELDVPQKISDVFKNTVGKEEARGATPETLLAGAIEDLTKTIIADPSKNYTAQLSGAIKALEVIRYNSKTRADRENLTEKIESLQSVLNDGNEAHPLIRDLTQACRTEKISYPSLAELKALIDFQSLFGEKTPLKEKDLIADEVKQAFDFIYALQSAVDTKQQGETLLSDWFNAALQLKSKQTTRGDLAYLNEVRLEDAKGISSLVQELLNTHVDEFSEGQKLALLDLSLTFIHDINHAFAEALLKSTHIKKAQK